MDLSQIYTDSIAFNEGTGKRRIYKQDGLGGYDSQAGDYSILTQNPDGTYVITEKDDLEYNFDAGGKIVSIVDRRGDAMTFTYTTGNLTGITDSVGRLTTLDYYPGTSKLKTITGPDPNRPKTVTFIYEAGTGYLSTVRDVLNHEWHYTYHTEGNGAGKLWTKADPNGNTTTYSYLSDGKLQSVLDPEEHTKGMSYSPSARTTTVTEKDGGVWTYIYDNRLGKLMQKSDPRGNTTSYTYDFVTKNMLTKRDPNNNVTTYQNYNGNDKVTAVIDQLGNTTTYTYNYCPYFTYSGVCETNNGFGQIASMKDPDGNKTTYGYDSIGNLKTITGPTGSIITYEYYPVGTYHGNLKSITNAEAEKTQFDAYDSNGNPTQITDAAGIVTTYIYDTNGNMTDQTVGEKTTHFDYTVLDQLWKVTDPLGNITEYTYDNNGNRKTVKEPKLPSETIDKITTYDYNYLGQVKKVTDALNNVTEYAYEGGVCSSCGGGSGSGRLTQVKDANLHTIGYEYDPQYKTGRLTRITDQLGQIETYDYDPAGNLVSVIDRKGQKTKYTYDSLNRIIRIDYYLDSAENNLESYTTYEYYTPADNQSTGKIKTITDSVSGTITYTYTTTSNAPMPIGLVRTETTPQGTITYEYDKTGRRTKMTVAGQPAVNYGYYTSARHNDITTTINGQS
ncbi:MAG: RHS repeat protein, partial [Nitrospirae bacterium]|nr:RHS repeat protein [Nitrospirota bacterium]